jgi:hypothetical protein
MTIAYYDVGEAIVCETTIVDDGGEPTDPTVVRFKHCKPDGTELVEIWPGDPDIENGPVGTFSRVLVAAIGEHGIWTWRFESDNPDTAKERTLVVRKTRFTA